MLITIDFFQTVENKSTEITLEEIYLVPKPRELVVILSCPYMTESNAPISFAKKASVTFECPIEYTTCLTEVIFTGAAIITNDRERYKHAKCIYSHMDSINEKEYKIQLTKTNDLDRLPEFSFLMRETDTGKIIHPTPNFQCSSGKIMRLAGSAILFGLFAYNLINYTNNNELNMNTLKLN